MNQVCQTNCSSIPFEANLTRHIHIYRLCYLLKHFINVYVSIFALKIINSIMHKFGLMTIKTEFKTIFDASPRKSGRKRERNRINAHLWWNLQRRWPPKKWYCNHLSRYFKRLLNSFNWFIFILIWNVNLNIIFIGWREKTRKLYRSTE